jgi:hypothetical protein
MTPRDPPPSSTTLLVSPHSRPASGPHYARCTSRIQVLPDDKMTTRCSSSPRRASSSTSATSSWSVSTTIAHTSPSASRRCTTPARPPGRSEHHRRVTATRHPRDGHQSRGPGSLNRSARQQSRPVSPATSTRPGAAAAATSTRRHYVAHQELALEPHDVTGSAAIAPASPLCDNVTETAPTLVLVQVEEDWIVGTALAAELRDELLALDSERVVELGARLSVQRDRPDHLAGLVVHLVGEALLEAAALVLVPLSRRDNARSEGKASDLSRALISATPPSGVGSGVEQIGRSANYRAGEGFEPSTSTLARKFRPNGPRLFAGLTVQSGAERCRVEAGWWCEVVWTFAVDVAATVQARALAGDLPVSLGDLSISMLP